MDQMEAKVSPLAKAKRTKRFEEHDVLWMCVFNLMDQC